MIYLVNFRDVTDTKDKRKSLSPVSNERACRVEALPWAGGGAHKKGLFFGQQKYAKDLLHRYEMIDCNPMSTPMDPNVRLQDMKGRTWRM